ncbi:NADPH:quinone oxidoreductase [Alkalilimnicola ehrlichii]|uniref:NADPH:quinone oxidoreductase family protein n=1 Tax=Alkalilimnicola ehrlichii TaxID=351052 RepID=UPI000E2EB96F|nr:NADPH:quinone oxidoreductase family protein [Alkalilimnicola ehrlichii]RFA27277.1 NADPH:quinone oxidoreductase [Alkalilimnicola ehrlichii]
MKAVLCKQYGPPESLVLEEVEPKPLQPGEVRVGVRACGVNFPDTLIIEGKYQFKPDMPFSPGGEVAGTVLELGEGVSGVEVGQPVIAMTGWGGYAEQVVTPPDRVLPMSPSMDFTTAAGFAMTYGTSMHALKQRANLKPGETLLVLGASGGVGLAAVELGRLLGARVIAAGGSDEKLKIAKEYGAEALINYNREDLKERVKELTGGKGADVIYDPVGGDAFDACMRAINWNGRLLVVGFASGRIPKVPVNLALLKGCQIVGVFWGAFRNKEPEANRENFRQMFDWVEQGKLKPYIGKTMPLEQASDALYALLNREAVGKIVLTVGD